MLSFVLSLTTSMPARTTSSTAAAGCFVLKRVSARWSRSGYSNGRKANSHCPTNQP